MRQRTEQLAERAAEMTKQLLGFSRQAELRLVPVDLDQILGNLSRVIRAVLPEDVEIRTFTDPSLPPITADPGALEQILLNLVTNARNAMTEGGRLTIEARAHDLGEPFVATHPYMEPGTYVSLEVTDTGTTPSTLPGSGQGIVGMQERAILLGGTFEAGPRDGGGFRVLARLPIGDQ